MWARIYGGLGKTAAATAQTDESVTEPASYATADASEQTGAATAQTDESFTESASVATAQTGAATAQTASATAQTGDATGGTITKTGEATIETGDATGENSATATGGTFGAVSESANQTATKQSQETYDNLPRGDNDLCYSPNVTADVTQQGCQPLDIAAILDAAKKGAQNAAELYDKGKQQGCCLTTIRMIHCKKAAREVSLRQK